jgi:D-alanine transaminase
MQNLAWINGEITALESATVPMEDRGYLLGDGVYEVIRVYRGFPFFLSAHLDRLQKSAAAIRIDVPYSDDEIINIITELIAKSGCVEGYLYMQVTRGSAARDHLFPAGASPSMTMYVRELQPVSRVEEVKPAACITLPDERWMNCNIKTINLLPNLLARQKSAEAGALEAVLYRPGGIVTEGTRSNFFVLVDGVVRTHPESNLILSGISRGIVLDILDQLSIPFREEAFRLEDLRKASEAWLTSTIMEVNPVAVIDGLQVNGGKPGSVSMKLMHEFRKLVEESIDRGVA